MKRVALMVSLLFLSISQAQAENGGQYYLVNLGYALSDADVSPDPLILASFSYGYGFSQKWAMEIDYSQSISGGEYSNTVGTVESDGEYSVWIASVNAAYRHLFKEVFYFKGKIGYTFGEERVTNSDVLTKPDTFEINAVSGGLGVGYLAGPIVGSSLTVELMLMKQFEDLTSIMIGANATF